MIRLALIEDNSTYRTALELYLKKAGDMEVVYSGNSISGLLKDLSLQPEVVIMDIDLGRESGIECVMQLKQVLPQAGIFMLTVFEDEDKIFQSIKAGALGYLLKKDPPQVIVEAVRKIHSGESVMNGVVARKMLAYFSQPKPGPNLEPYKLTPREREILGLLIEGLSYKEIASNCFISIDTLNSHIRKIYTKLDVHSRSEIAARFR